MMREHAARADGFPVFDVPPDTPPLTSEMVRKSDGQRFAVIRANPAAG